ncbi:MAG: nuclear transport factor 2 family protein, partial [Verrucomicrobiota bacterium]
QHRTMKHQQALSSPLIEVEGDAARGTAYLLATAVAAADGAGFYVTGTYHDEYVRGDAGWLFATRIRDVDWMAGQAAVDERFPPLGFPVHA